MPKRGILVWTILYAGAATLATAFCDKSLDARRRGPRAERHRLRPVHERDPGQAGRDLQETHTAVAGLGLSPDDTTINGDVTVDAGWFDGNAVWNMVFSGVEGAPAQSFPEPPYTTLQSTPLSREKPFLYLDGAKYKVFLPELRANARGVSWGSGTPRGTSVPLSRFYVARPGVSAATLNQALDEGLHLLFTPGIYHLDRTVEVRRAGTVVLGLGYATLIPDNGVTALKVADVGHVDDPVQGRLVPLSAYPSERGGLDGFAVQPPSLDPA